MKLRAESVGALFENMLEANKSAWFETVFTVYNRNLLKRRFHSFQVSGLNLLRNKKSASPLMIYANHSSWWDGLAAFQISRRAKLDSYLMMEEKQLKKLFLFRRIGAFSVIRENPRKALESVNYSVQLLKKPNRTLWIFPQGAILPNDARPLLFQNGLARIIEKIGEVTIMPLAFRYEFSGEYKPRIFAKIGNFEKIKTDSDFDSKIKSKIMADILGETLDRLKRDILENKTSDFENII